MSVKPQTKVTERKGGVEMYGKLDEVELEGSEFISKQH